MNFILRNKIVVLGMIVGAIGGYLYYHYIGCASGTCAITSKPLNSTLYGALMGGLFLNMFQNKKQNKNEN
jgi:phage shock protein E